MLVLIVLFASQSGFRQYHPVVLKIANHFLNQA
jgi:hypothetical protein